MRAFAVPVLLLFALLAGCAGGAEDDHDDEHGDNHDDGNDLGVPAMPVLFLNITAANETFRFSSGSQGGAGVTGNVSTTGSATGTGANATGNATGNASANATAPGGLAPLNVTFTLGASHLPAGASANWTFDFGRGSAANATNGTDAAGANGTTLPATFEHTYTAAGTYNVTFILQAGNLTPQALQATIHIANGTGNVSVTKPLPDQMHFEFGESLGCTADISPTGIACISFELGPDGSGIDGFWIELTDLYWGLSFTSTVGNVRGDSDAAVLDADLAVMPVDVNGGGTQATGTIPEGAAWLFIFSYAEPSTGMTVTFAAA